MWVDLDASLLAKVVVTVKNSDAAGEQTQGELEYVFEYYDGIEVAASSNYEIVEQAAR